MGHDDRLGQIGSPATRRAVVKAGVRLAYAAPLVAASFKLTGHGALAGTSCARPDGSACAPSARGTVCTDQALCPCVCDEYSPKVLEGACYSCKVPAAHCTVTKSGLQADELVPGPDAVDDLYCRCQGAKCEVYDPATKRTVTFLKGENVTAKIPTCRPAKLTCSGGGGAISGF